MTISNDKEYIILTQLDANPKASQRDISRQTGFSLGSVNLLLKKMISRGVVKMEEIPANRVAYMLTPAGILEKAQKTVKYVKVHYTIIEKMKEDIKFCLKTLLNQHDSLYFIHSEDEFSRLTELALREMNAKENGSIIYIQTVEEIEKLDIPILHVGMEFKNDISNPIVNLPERVMLLETRELL